MLSERSVEVPWAITTAQPPTLDVGCVGSIYLHELLGPVDGIDVRSSPVSGLRHRYVEDLRTFVAPEPYRTVLAISSLEHVGLLCPTYGTKNDAPSLGGDIAALQACVRATMPGGRVLLSVPFGQSRNYGWFRQYDRARLAEFLEGLEHSYEVWVRAPQASDPWLLATGEQIEEAEALEYDEPGGSARAVALITVEVR